MYRERSMKRKTEEKREKGVKYLRANDMVATTFPGKRVDGGVVQVDVHFPITAVLVATR